MGSPAHSHPDLEECRKVEIGHTLAAAEAFTSCLAPALREKGKAFRFVYLSGMLANRDTNKSLWFMHNARTIKVCSINFRLHSRSAAIPKRWVIGRGRKWIAGFAERRGQ
jgi:hypothetical protein